MAKLKLFAVISSSQVGGGERYFVTLLKGLASRDVEVSVACPAAGPTVSTVYGAYHLPVGVTGLRGVRRRALSLSYRAIYGRFDRIIALSEYIRDDLAGRRGLRASAGAVEVIAPGLDADRSKPGAAGRHRRANALRIINVANFFAIKGQEVLLRALPRVLKQFPGLECLFVGEGPERASLEALAARLGVAARVVFAGAVADPLDLVSESDVFVLPSLSEGLPMSILEAWSLGTPVVASRAGGIPEAVEDGRNGLLVPARDPEALADAVNAVLSNPALGEKLAAEGRKDVRSRFSPEVMAERTAALVSLRAEVGTLALDLASGVIGEALNDDKKSTALVDRFLADLESSSTTKAK